MGQLRRPRVSTVAIADDPRSSALDYVARPDSRDSTGMLDHSSSFVIELLPRFQFRDAFGDFLRAASQENPSMPSTVQDLERQLGVRLIVLGSRKK